MHEPQALCWQQDTQSEWLLLKKTDPDKTELSEIDASPAALEEGDVQAEPEIGDDGARHERLTIRRLLPDRRIDKYLHHRFPDFSRTMIQRLIKEEAVTVNDQPTKASYGLSPGDKIDIILPPPPVTEIPGEEIPLNIIYEDEHMIVLNKQAHLIVHPARGNRSGTLVNGLVYYSNSLSSGSGDFRPGIVHRLDRNTTGVIVVAKTDLAHWRIAHQFEHRLTQKTYLAIVQGQMELDADVLDLPLGRHPKVREKYAVRTETGKPAVTTYHVIEQFNGYAFVRLQPKTGRTHQLRVHMSAIHHPVVADDMYGGREVTLEQLVNGQPLPGPDEPGGALPPGQPVISRQALHAYELQIRHPHTGKMMTLRAELPEDMDTLLKLLARYRKK